jgi:L-asparaginase
MKNPILIINTGGTFNKVYDPVKGSLIVDTDGSAIKAITQKWCCYFDIIDIIGKDSLEITNHDRLELLATIHQSEYRHIVIVHGTDTMDITATYLADADLEKQIVLTGAMVPFSIDPVEATANFASACGFLQTTPEEGIYVAMHGMVAHHTDIVKNRESGRFERR